jgi:hypothetical protein
MTRVQVSDLDAEAMLLCERGEQQGEENTFLAGPLLLHQMICTLLKLSLSLSLSLSKSAWDGWALSLSLSLSL